MTSSRGDGGSRVSIPADLLKTIQNIREVTGKQHSDEDIFSVFKECFNDPHETTQKLLYLDTFHEVRSKRERKKENLVLNTQGRSRTARRNFGSSYTDTSNGRSAAFKKQSGANHIKGRSGTVFSSPNNAINDTKPSSIKSPNPIISPSGISNHKIQEASISPVNKEVTEEQPLSKSTSSSEDVVEPDKSKASTVPVAVSDSVVKNDTQYTLDGTSQISQQSSMIVTSNYSQSEQVGKSDAAANKGKNQSLLESGVGERSHVTFPVHLQVAKMLENGLTFGSFDSNFVKEASSDNCTIGCDDSNIESSHGTATRKDISTISQDEDHEILNSASETEPSLQSDQTLHPVEGSEGDKPLTDTHQAPNCDAQPISYPDQYSIAAYQQAMHLFRQQFPLNLFPYGPYLPPFYMPHPYIHQFVSPNGYQQQSYLPPPGDDASPPSGVKLPLTHIKSGSDIENSPPTTIPSPYDLYAFNHFPSAATVTSTNKEEKKENIYSTGPPSLANLQASPMYNLPFQCQPLAFPTMQAGFTGIYQQSQPILAPPTISARTEPIGPSHITNQQPQAALTNQGNN
ncbi:PREDICTED: GBF-interacting protein 1-like [Camelina sativa]|uniref:GBF-interacting protein 1-like n=1 Tax=Camelina sativa TaxID=90675 RepID=A0ABM0W3E8_CAMSA|nr:PREDICTED: GBF-interacting protein 1-like [Camelina sativa]